MKLHLDRFDNDKFDNNTKKDSKLHAIIFDAVNRMLQKSDLRDLYHGIGLEDVQYTKQNGLSSNIYTQVSFFFSTFSVVKLMKFSQKISFRVSLSL